MLKFLGHIWIYQELQFKTLKKNNADDANGLLYDIIDSWLDQTEPSWEELARVLGSGQMEYQRIARKCVF